MSIAWQPYREPLSATLARTLAIALLLGAVLTRFWGGGVGRWPMATLLMVWPSLGGHYVELWFLNWLRPRLSSVRNIQVGARIAVWFAGGIVLALGMTLTGNAAGYSLPAFRLSWWVAGLAGLGFIAVELVAQLALLFRGRPSFYDGRG
jgi:hypothetical protein